MKNTYKIKYSLLFTLMLALLFIKVSVAQEIIVEEPERPLCKGKVIQTPNPDGSFSYELMCFGACKNDTDTCKKLRESIPGFGLFERCACPDTKLDDCHIVRFIPAPGWEGLPYFCSGKCPEGTKCKESKKALPNGQTEITCACQSPPISGCTNPVACNYDPEAEIDDGSCLVPIPECTKCDELGIALEIIDSDGDGACDGRDLCPNDPDRGDITCGTNGDRIRMCFFKKIIGEGYIFVFAYSVCVSEEKAAELIQKPGWNFGYCGQNFHCEGPGNPDDPIITDPTRKGEIGRIYEYEELQEILPLLEEDINMKAFPNPVTDKGTIQFMLPETEKVSLKLYNMAGMEVARLYENYIEGGIIYEVNFDTGNLPGGVYFYKLTTASGKQLTCKVMISR